MVSRRAGADPALLRSHGACSFRAFAPTRASSIAWGDCCAESCSVTTRSRGAGRATSAASPDTSRTLSRRPMGGLRRLPRGELWKCRPDGSQRVRLTRPGTVAAFPRWSPDGRELSYLGVEPGETAWSLNRVSADGTGEEVLARPGAGATFLVGRLLAAGGGGPGVLAPTRRSRPAFSDWTCARSRSRRCRGRRSSEQPKCSRQGHLLASDLSTGRSHVLWRGHKDWQEVDADRLRLAYPNWDAKTARPSSASTPPVRAWSDSTSRLGGGRPSSSWRTHRSSRSTQCPGWAWPRTTRPSSCATAAPTTSTPSTGRRRSEPSMGRMWFERVRPYRLSVFGSTSCPRQSARNRGT